eukprot:TRINITY_DN4766_c0_g1_i4.p1 TRINITY_DN4766_c0_g1~~TRINITY_DN4766_c0_g1_i4.p1  ORF type:complete len:205 (-),score=13.47 TRINITY_DN4766_c0_g1_i4:81-695(-)
MRLAVVGCAHGELDIIYNTLSFIEQLDGIKFDLLLCCGDFQAVRNQTDLDTMACPPKYRTMNSFYKYYSGEKKAPVLTIFVGGNHEATNHLWELYFGGWAAENIYYLGHSGVVDFGGLKIAGYSGIYNHKHFNNGYFEKYPLSQSDNRSVYHVRKFEAFKLLLMKNQIDIFLSHDWPQGIVHSGDYQRLFRQKPHFREEVVFCT